MFDRLIFEGKRSAKVQFRQSADHYEVNHFRNFLSMINLFLAFRHYEYTSYMHGRIIQSAVFLCDIEGNRSSH